MLVLLPKRGGLGKEADLGLMGKSKPRFKHIEYRGTHETFK